jgi:hypothetical protein
MEAILHHELHVMFPLSGRPIFAKWYVGIPSLLNKTSSITSFKFLRHHESYLVNVKFRFFTGVLKRITLSLLF